MHDEHNHEIRIYDINGRKVARRSASIANSTKPCGILVNLRTITSIFQSHDDMEIDNDLYEGEDNPSALNSNQNKVSLSVYPQAFLRDYGHIQAKGPMQLMQPTIQRINSNFAESFDDDEDDIFDDYDRSHTSTPLITAISTQMYNEFMHRAATQAGALDVVRGRMSSALAAAPPSSRVTASNRRMADVLKRYCNLSLPHERFAERREVPDCPTSLRVESVYIIDMRCIREDQRSGRFVIQLQY
jgi:hypothetical protein